MVKRSGNWIVKSRRHGIYERDNWTCAYCAKDLKNADSFDITLDHIRPVSKGGTNQNSNLVTCCRECNTKRGVKTVSSFASKEAQKEIKNRRRRKVINKRFS